MMMIWINVVMCNFLCNEWTHCRNTTFSVEIVFSATRQRNHHHKLIETSLKTRRKRKIVCCTMYICVCNGKKWAREKIIFFQQCFPKRTLTSTKTYDDEHHQKQNKIVSCIITSSRRRTVLWLRWNHSTIWLALGLNLFSRRKTVRLVNDTVPRGICCATCAKSFLWGKIRFLHKKDTVRIAQRVIVLRMSFCLNYVMGKMIIRQVF